MASNNARAQGAPVAAQPGSRWRWRRVGALLLLAPLLAIVGVQAPAQAANNVGVPAGNPAAGQAKLVVKKGGDRTSTTTVGPLAGAQFKFYRVGGSGTLTGGTAMADTCTTDASGQCGIFAPLDGSGDNYFYAEEIATPSGWTEADVWGSASDHLRYNSQAVRASNTDRLRLLPPAGRTWPNVRNNPTAPQKCGLDIRMIFDVSGSIDNNELTTFKNAGKGVVDALASTPSRVSLSRFASQAANVSALTAVATPAGATAVKNAIDGIGRNDLGGQYTNWDRALWGSTTTGEAYDVALIITDGDPTVYGDLTSGDTELRQVEEAIHSANALKAKNTQVIAVGINLTGAASIKRLNLVSSPSSTYTTSWQQLGADLKAIATGFCNKVVTVQKVVKDWQGNVMANSPESNGWQFTGQVAAPATIGAFAPTAQVNGQNGFASAPVAIPAGTNPTITISEGVKPGWTFQGASCTVDGQQVAVTPNAQVPGRFTFPGKANATMACTVTNQQDPPKPKLTLVKKVLNADGTVAPASAGQAWTLSATGSSLSFSGAGNTAAVTGKDVAAGVPYALAESNLAGYTNGTTWACVKDSGPGSITFASPNKVTLAAGQAATCTITNQVKLADLVVSKTAVPSFERDYDWTIVKSVTNGSRFEVPQGTAASVNYRVVVTPSAPKNTNFKVTGVITVTNPNPVPITGVMVLDSMPGSVCSVPGGPATIGANASITRAYECTVPAGTPTTTATNTASATWDASDYHGTSGSATGTAPVDFADATVTTTDATALVTDTMIDIDGTAPDGVVVQATGGPKTFNYTRPITGTPGKCTTHDNTATVKPSDSAGSSDTETVTVCVGVDLEVDKVATLAFDREYKWKVAKTGPGHLFVGDNGGTASYDVKLETDGYRDHDWKLGGTIWISNPNAWAMDVTISDVTTLDGRTLTCTVTGGSAVTIPANANRKAYAYTCAGVEQGAYQGTNTATVSWDKAKYFTPNGSDAHTVPVSVSGVAGSQNASVTLSDVFDGGTATTVGDGPYLWSQVKDNAVTVTYTRPVTAPSGACRTYDNTVSVVGTTAQGTATTRVCSPGVTKSVIAEYGQRQTWSLKKEVDKTSVELGPDDTVTFNYVVTATPGAVVDEGQARWSGTIAVTNPSTSEVFNGTVTDAPAVAGWTCAIVGDGKVTVQPGGTANVSYSCTTQGTGHPDGTNTARVSWPGHVVGRTVDVKFTSTGTIDRTTTITDDIPNDGLPAKTFPVDASKGINTFSYSNTTLGATAGQCSTYTNNAVLAATGEDPTASQTVKVCREKPLTVAVDASGSFDRDHNWDIAKEADRTTVEVDAETGSAVFGYTVTVRGLQPTDSGYEMSGAATVSNPNTYADGSITLTGGSISATHGGGVTCTPTAPIAGRVIAADASIQVPFTCEFTGTPALSGSVSLSVTWDPAGPAPSADASGSDAVTLVIDGEQHASVDVIDDKTDPANPVVLERGLPWSSGLVKEYTYELTHQGVAGRCTTFTNTAVVDLTPQGEQRAVDEDGNPVAVEDVEVCVEAPLQAALQAAGDLARDYAWSIDKSVDRTTVTVNGATAVFNYTVVVRAGASTDSAWRASGVVTVTNPNTYGDGAITLTGASLSTTFGPGVACAPNAAVAGRVVPVDGSIQIPFTCTFANAPTANAATVSAAVTWDPAGASESDTADATSGATLAVARETNKVVDVVDDQTVPGRRIVLEQGLAWSPGLVKTYTYSLALPVGAAGTTTPYTNIATVDLPEGPDVSDTVTVQVSAPEVAPEQAFGKATGKVRASCQGTVTARMRNATGGRVTYVLKVGKKTHRIKVASGKKRVFQTKGKARVKVVLKVGPQTLDRVRVPKLCLPPEVLPETGLRAAANARLGSITHRWG